MRSNGRLRTGRVITGLAVIFLSWDAVIKIMNLEVVLESFARLGYPEGIALTIGTLELVCLAVYVVPRTSFIGAVLLTGYLGGAIATHVRVGDPLASHVLFPVYVAALIWGGLYLRDGRLRSLVPLPARRRVSLEERAASAAL